MKRSEKPAYFQPSDVYILGTSLGVQNTLNVEFAVLFPSVEGQPPQVTPAQEVVQVVDESKEIIEKDVGGEIHKTSVVLEGKATEKPTKGKNLLSCFLM